MKIYKESTLPNGLSIITIEDGNSEVVTATMWINAGSRYEKSNERGLAHLLEHMLVKETKKHSLNQLGLLVDRMGAYLNANTSIESISLRSQVSKNYYKDMIEILAEITTQPFFNSQTLENEKKTILEEIARAKDSRGVRMGIKSMELIFRDYPLAQNPLGSEECVRNTTPEQLQKYYDTYIRPDRSTLIMSGNITHNDIISLAQKLLVSSWKQEEKDDKKEEKTFPPKKSGNSFAVDMGNQTQLFFNFICPDIQLKELAAVELTANILAYGKTPVLKQELRYKEGLIYAVSAYTSKFRDATLFYISTATTKPKEVIERIKKIISDLKSLYSNEQKLKESKEQFKNVLMRQLINPTYEIELLWILKKLTGKMINPLEMAETIDSLTSKEILGTVDKFLVLDNLFITAFGEKNPFE